MTGGPPRPVIPPVRPDAPPTATVDAKLGGRDQRHPVARTPTTTRMRIEITQRIAVGSTATSSHTPIGTVNNAPILSGSTSRQEQRRVADTTIGMVSSSSITNSRITAVAGSVSALATGTKIIAAPKPEKPRTSPATIPATISPISTSVPAASRIRASIDLTSTVPTSTDLASTGLTLGSLLGIGCPAPDSHGRRTRPTADPARRAATAARRAATRITTRGHGSTRNADVYGLLSCRHQPD